MTTRIFQQENPNRFSQQENEGNFVSQNDLMYNLY